MKSWLVSVVPFLLWMCCTSQNVCEEPLDIDFGEISHKKVKYMESDRIQYKCNPGYVLEGSEWIICSGQAWTPSPRCLAPCSVTKQHLDAKKLLLTGNRRYSQVVQHNLTLEFLCREGYVLKAPSVRKCIDGHMDLPLCISERGENCSRPPTIENGDIITLSQKQYTSGSSVEFKCQKYYALEGDNISFCDNGNWTNVPICIEPCSISLTEIETKKMEMKERSDENRFENIYVQHGTSVELTCKPGYTAASIPSQSAFVIQCSGEQIVYPECKEITCNSLRVANGHFRPQRNVYHDGDLIQIKCDDGFQLDDGGNLAECTKNGWSLPPECRDVTCPPPPQIPNGHLNGQQKQRYLPLEKVSYRCSQGYRLSGPLTVTCLNKQWTELPRCTGRTCGNPPRVDNADIVRGKADVYLSGHLVLYQCHEGFGMSEMAFITCRGTEWSQSPTCEDVTCPPPPQIPNGQLEGQLKQRYLPLEKVSYRCSEGYRLSGPLTATCLNKKWTELPSCTDRTCGDPPRVENADIVRGKAEVYLPGHLVLYQCHEGFEMSELAFITCRGTEWSQSPTCEDVTCPPPPQIPNGQPNGQLKQRYLPLEKVSYRCSQGYRISGPLTATCLNKKWIALPRCTDRTCGNPPRVDNADIVRGKAVLYLPGHLVLYQCHEGFEMSEMAFIVCRGTEWSQSPTCEETTRGRGRS